jgi:glycosyltransferase involved in cell wall biosynthesis
MKPHILIDASVVISVADGLSVYVINLLKHLPDEAFEQFDFSILLRPGLDRPEFFAALEGRPFRLIEETIAPIGPRRDWDMFRFLRRRGQEFDLVHITSNQYPLFLRHGICTIHDVTFKRWFHNPGGIPGARHAAVAYLTLVISNCLRRAGRIIADSEATRQEIRRLFHATPAQMDKIDVVHLGWEHLRDEDETATEAIDPLPYPDKSFLFFLGTFRPHKNLAGLLRGFERVLDSLPEDKLLVVSGDGSDRLSPELKAVVDRINAKRQRVIFTGYLSGAEVRRHYAQADAFVFPSLAEGFGLPVLEAFHYGIPLLCANNTSLPEVAGDGALYFDPTDPDSIGDALVRFYQDPGLRERLIAKGRERLQHFSWQKTAEQTLQIYRQQAERLRPSPHPGLTVPRKTPAHA